MSGLDLNGVYPFNVNIWNIFENQKIKVHVKYYHFNNYDYRKALLHHQSTGERPDLLCSEHDIPGGVTLVFPLFFPEEYLELSVLPPDPTNDTIEEHYIWAGIKAKCVLIDERGLERQPSPVCKGPILELEEPKEFFYPGGTWKANSNDWKLKIKKYKPDPEEDDVIIGPENQG